MLHSKKAGKGNIELQDAWGVDWSEKASLIR